MGDLWAAVLLASFPFPLFLSPTGMEVLPACALPPEARWALAVSFVGLGSARSVLGRLALSRSGTTRGSGHGMVVLARPTEKERGNST